MLDAVKGAREPGIAVYIFKPIPLLLLNVSNFARLMKSAIKEN
jgi:hypothetical protein